MRYESSRGGGGTASFEELLLGGTAPDGGLWMPEVWPALEGLLRPEIDYPRLVAEMMAPYTVDCFDVEELHSMAREAYAAFPQENPVPLQQYDENRWLLNLHCGPTLAFKDLAMQLLARMVESVLKRQDRQIAILAATSGDTGSAAIEAFGGMERVRVFVLFPSGRVSSVQRRQMTAAGYGNVHALSVRGSFDDAQALVKGAFADAELVRSEGLVAVNSINWARILPQAAYYFWACRQLGGAWPAFCVPSGNFGDAFAGFVAKMMGLAARQIIVATNGNDILHRILDTGRGERRPVEATYSPSMDIQAASNFERALFEASGRDGVAVADRMESFAGSGALALEPGERASLADTYGSARVSEQETLETIAATHARCGLLVDPHTAVGLRAAEMQAIATPVVVLSTAHPAKFPEAVREACGVEQGIPPRLRRVLVGEEHAIEIDADLDMLRALMQLR